jgi:RiboL-PSP-HEPN
MTKTSVDRLHEDFSILMKMLDRAGEISLITLADDSFRKSLLLSAASQFEHELTETLASFVDEASNANVLITSFLKNKAISRQYHTLFNWDENNANQFFGFFGAGFRDYMKRLVKTDPELDESIRAFLEIGRERNRLVHQNYAAFTLEKTADEIYGRYLQARHFIDRLASTFHGYLGYVREQ